MSARERLVVAADASVQADIRVAPSACSPRQLMNGSVIYTFALANLFSLTLQKHTLTLGGVDTKARLIYRVGTANTRLRRVARGRLAFSMKFITAVKT